MLIKKKGVALLLVRSRRIFGKKGLSFAKEKSKKRATEANSPT